MGHTTYDPWGEIRIGVGPRTNCKKCQSSIAGVLLKRREMAIKGKVSSRKDFCLRNKSIFVGW